MDSRSPGGSGDGVRCGASVGSFTDLGGVGRGGQGWGRSRLGALKGSPPGSVVRFGPKIPAEGQHG